MQKKFRKILKKALPKLAVQFLKELCFRSLYNRSKLVNATIDTVKHNLLEGAILVVVILFALLGNFKAAFIVFFSNSIIYVFLLFTGMVIGKN